MPTSARNKDLLVIRRGDPRGRPPAMHHTPCKNPCHCEPVIDSLVWQSASPVPLAPLPKGGWHGEAVTGGFFPRPPGRAHGPCPTRCCVIGPGRTGSSAPTRNSVGDDAHIVPPHRTPCNPRRGRRPRRPACHAPHSMQKKTVIAKPVRTLAVAIRNPRPQNHCAFHFPLFPQIPPPFPTVHTFFIFFLLQNTAPPLIINYVTVLLLSHTRNLCF